MDAKPIYRSRTVWGAALMLLAAGLSALGVVVTPDEQTGAVETIVRLVDDAAILVGFALTIYGRYKAAGPVTVLPAKQEP